MTTPATILVLAANLAADVGVVLAPGEKKDVRLPSVCVEFTKKAPSKKDLLAPAGIVQADSLKRRLVDASWQAMANDIVDLLPVPLEVIAWEREERAKRLEHTLAGRRLRPNASLSELLAAAQRLQNAIETDRKTVDGEIPALPPLPTERRSELAIGLVEKATQHAIWMQEADYAKRHANDGSMSLEGLAVDLLASLLLDMALEKPAQVPSTSSAGGTTGIRRSTSTHSR